MKRTLLILSCFLAAFGLAAQSSIDFWNDVSAAQIVLPENSAPDHEISAMRTLTLDFSGLKNHLRQTPMEDTGAQPMAIDLPMPDGTTERFGVFVSPIMEAGLAAKYPEIQTFAGHSLDRPRVDIRFVLSPIGGFNALIISDGGNVRVSPYVGGQVEFYNSYFEENIIFDENAEVYECQNHDVLEADELLDHAHLPKGQTFETVTRNSAGTVDRYEYRIAIATTGEFSNASGGTVSSVLTYVTQVMSDINLVFNRDAAIRMIIVDNTDKIFFFSPQNDPYTNGQTDVMIGENPPVLADSIGISNFDIGHVFGTNAGGLAQLQSVCSSMKAEGVSCQFGNYVGNAFYLIPAHEMGHQFNATHTFNLCDGDNETASTGYEPGSGTTIMSYSGASNCSSQWPQSMNDSYFHSNSIERIGEFTRGAGTGGSCAEVIPVGNNCPEVELPYVDGFFIPISTPFELTAEASDADGDDITYAWEHYNIGPESNLGNPIGDAPSFRSFLPTNSPTRVFPRIQRVVENISHPHEVLPTSTRDFTFRCTVRDNNPDAGGTAFQEVEFDATDEAGPFLVQSPNDGTEAWEVGDFVEVTWDVANTDGALVNCQSVNIRLSLDGGYTYPITLLSATQNDGTDFVTVPDEVTSTARVRVEAADNIFFDISNNDFSIVPPTEPGFALEASTEGGLVCLPEAFEASFQTTSLLGFSEEISFSVDGLPNGAIASFSSDVINPGNVTDLTIDVSSVDVVGDFTVTVFAEADGLPVAVRTLDLFLVSNDISALQLLSPPGASGTNTLPSFGWSALPNAITYNIQIATDAAFTNIVAEGTALPEPSYDLPVQLESNTVYFWHISINNECGMGEWSFPGAFKTLGQVCTQNSQVVNLEISDIGTPTVISTINLTAGGEINDVNIANVKGQFDSFGDLEILLEGPAGSIVLMPEDICFANAPFDFGIDDEAPSNIPCAPDNGVRYKPANPLSFFDGSDSQGDWTLSFKVTDSFGSEGGIFESWDLEVCGAFAFSDPFLVTNETLGVPPNETNLIFVNTLEVADDDNVAQDLTFTIVDDVDAGFISVGGTQLGVGGQFTMTDIYSSQVTYTNTDGTALADNFAFIVEDPDGGFLGTPVYSIEIDEGAIIGAAGDVLNADELLVFPNPTSSVLNIVFKNEVRGEANAVLFNAQGQLLKTAKWDALAGTFQLDVSELPTGFHLLQVSTESGIYSKKVMVE